MKICGEATCVIVEFARQVCRSCFSQKWLLSEVLWLKKGNYTLEVSSESFIIVM